VQLQSALETSVGLGSEVSSYLLTYKRESVNVSHSGDTVVVCWPGT
jgi:hypothetical protein